MIFPAQPQSRAVPMAWAARRRAAGGAGVPAAEPGRAQDRGGDRGADHRDQRVSPLTSRYFPAIFAWPNAAPSFW